MRKLKCRKVKQLASSDIVRNWQSQGLNLDNLLPEHIVLSINNHVSLCEYEFWVAIFFSLLIYSVSRWGESGTSIYCWLVHILSLRNFGLRSKFRSIVVFWCLKVYNVPCYSMCRHMTQGWRFQECRFSSGPTRRTRFLSVTGRVWGKVADGWGCFMRWEAECLKSPSASENLLVVSGGIVESSETLNSLRS